MLTVSLVNQADEVIADMDWITASARHELMAEGGWEVVAPGDPDVFNLIRSRTEPYWVLLTDHATGEVHGGPIRGRPMWRGSESDGVIVLAGGNANWYANTTIVLPVHTQSNYPGESAPRSQRGYTLPQMHGSRAIYELVDDQVNNTGLPYRNLDTSLTLASLVDTGFELTGYEAEPFEPLLETIRRWGLESGVIADFRWRGSSTTAELVTRLPTVREFRLWEQDGSVLDWEWFEEADAVNYLWAGGKGEGVNRAVWPVAPPDPIPAKWGLAIERFLDASSSDSPADGTKAAEVTIRENAATDGIKTTGVAADGIEFGTDYLLGDIVSTVFLRTEYLRVVEAVQLDWAADGKTETIETGEPALAVYNQPGVTLGEQPAVVYQPAAGLTIGELSLRQHWTPDDINVELDIEIVYAKVAGLDPADRPFLSLEVRVDGGSWQPASAGPTTLRLDGGGEDIRYLTRSATDSTSGLTGFTTSLEYRAFLTQTGETTVYSPVLQLGVLPALPGAPESLAVQRVSAGDTDAARFNWSLPVDAGAPPADRLEIERRLAGTTPWTIQADATNPTTGTTQLGHAYTDGDEWEYRVRFVNDTGAGDWSSVVSVTYPSTGAFFTTSDGGYFTTSDGGFFTVDES